MQRYKKIDIYFGVMWNKNSDILDVPLKPTEFPGAVLWGLPG